MESELATKSAKAADPTLRMEQELPHYRGFLCQTAQRPQFPVVSGFAACPLSVAILNSELSRLAIYTPL